MTEPAELRNHDLNLFVVFVALMEERSVTRAALRLHMSQAAVSAALSRLRKMHGDQLFVRAPGGVAPTLRAQRMYGPILEGLRSFEVAIGGEPIFDPHTDRFTLRIGMSDDLEAVLMPEVLSTVQPRSPGLSLYCVQTTRLRMAALLEAGDADLGVSASTAWGSQFRSRELFESGYASVYDPRLVGHDGALTKEEYLSLPHIMISYDGTRGIVDDALEAEGLSRNRIASTAHFAMAPYLLTRVATIATMPRHVARVFGRHFGLAVCEPPIYLPSFTVSVVWHQARDFDPRVKWMVRTVEDLAKSLEPARRTA
ncbi:LysR family transcriptional regulator [Actinoplanes sp. NPDC051851]|uniref:LysR family transcriptional regulator n=1 Tax=Actinoplanes sp. NPDC051851 TaxID=3154753 RepID=UPI003443DB2F